MEEIIRGATVYISETPIGSKTKISWVTQIEDTELGGYALVDKKDLVEVRDLIRQEAKKYIEEHL